MPSRAGGPAFAGVSLRLQGTHAVVLRDDDITWIDPTDLGQAQPDDVDDAERLIGAIIVAAGGALEAVTIDISQVLLDAVVLGTAELPPVAVIRIVPRPATDPAP